ncbi:MAG TPA: hypothetical protein PLA71_00915 [Saccharofermentans sp.]|nr:hypothetical protein [Saccharofermentans sp.]
MKFSRLCESLLNSKTILEQKFTKANMFMKVSPKEFNLDQKQFDKLNLFLLRAIYSNINADKRGIKIGLTSSVLNWMFEKFYKDAEKFFKVTFSDSAKEAMFDHIKFINKLKGSELEDLGRFMHELDPTLSDDKYAGRPFWS